MPFVMRRHTISRPVPCAHTIFRVIFGTTLADLVMLLYPDLASFGVVQSLHSGRASERKTSSCRDFNLMEVSKGGVESWD